jgi:hypothetical protein
LENGYTAWRGEKGSRLQLLLGGDRLAEAASGAPLTGPPKPAISNAYVLHACFSLGGIKAGIRHSAVTEVGVRLSGGKKYENVLHFSKGRSAGGRAAIHHLHLAAPPPVRFVFPSSFSRIPLFLPFLNSEFSTSPDLGYTHKVGYW